LTTVTAAGDSLAEDRHVNARNTILALLVVAALFTAVQRFERRPVRQPDGEVAAGEPLQGPAADTSPLRIGRWVLTPRAEYDITARILSREDYRFDVLAELVPEDLALGWGPMSDNRVLRAFDISQEVRFYTWSPRGPMPISRATVISHSANTHVIPADPAVRDALERLRVGDVVRLRGPLVDGKRDDGVAFHTSLTRLDSGPGACEVVLVRSVELTR